MHRLLPIALLALLVGCESPEELLPPVVISTPLEMDPETAGTLPRWWLGTDTLLYLHEDDGYRIFDGTSHHQPVAEHGRWSHPTYAQVLLEPYSRFDRGRTRLTLDRVADGGHVLTDGDGHVLVGLDGPPPAPEDDVIGRWSGDIGHLDLETGLQYRFTAMQSAGDDAYVPGHTGQWTIANDVITLHPFAGNLGPYRFTVTRDEDDEDRAIAITSDIGALSGPS